MSDMPLTKISETATTITLGWTPPSGCSGYVFYADAKRSSTFDGTRSSVKFAKGATTYRVQALGVLAEGTYPAATTSKVLFEDNFDNDLGKWNVGWFGTAGPVNSAEAAGYKNDHARIVNGMLEMSLTADPIYSAKLNRTLPYTGALLTTQGRFTFVPPVRLEARMFLPGSSGVGNWPAFWSNGSSWPTDGENDVMEGLGGDACWHYHSPLGGPGGCATGNWSGWHTFTSEVQAGKASYFYDSVFVGEISQGVNMVAPHYLILQQSISDHHPETALVPATMLVDYVRVTAL